MPTYAYACTACEHTFEIVQSFKDDSLTRCPECEGRLRKMFNAVGVVFKGSGFYSTDSRTSSGNRAGKSSRTGSVAGSGSSSSSEAGGSSAGSSSNADSSSTGSGTKTATKTSSASEGSAA